MPFAGLFVSPVWVRMSRFAPIEKGNVVSALRETRSYFPNIIPEFEHRFSHERYDDSARPYVRTDVVGSHNTFSERLLFIRRRKLIASMIKI